MSVDDFISSFSQQHLVSVGYFIFKPVRLLKVGLLYNQDNLLRAGTPYLLLLDVELNTVI
jgi:hypothetical protein